MPDSPRQTPLCAAHQALGARMVDFSGWLMPVQYDGILAEHHRTRTDVTMFDTCHMGRFMVSGAGALDGLSAILSADLRTMTDGQCRYGFLLRDDGGILDDTITYRFNAEKWMVVVNAGTRDKDHAWILGHLPASVSFEDHSDVLAKIDVQGPNALMRVSSVLGCDVGVLRYFRFMTVIVKGREIVVSRTGYTGENGLELYVGTEGIVDLWESFLKAGVKPAGLGARDTLRLEASLPLYGHELSEMVTPVEAGMERYAAKSEAFCGGEAVRRRLTQGPQVRLCGFRIEGRQSARAGNRVLAKGQEIGRVTSGSFSPSLQNVLGFSYIASACTYPGNRVTVDTGRTLLEAELIRIPFYKAVKKGA
jgi:aminomethyltransferase